jgi:hypothetical protein
MTDSSALPSVIDAMDTLEHSRTPDEAAPGDPSVAAINAIGVIPFRFEFKKRNQTGTPAPGSVFEDTRVVTIPSGAGFFITLNYIDCGFREENLVTLRERGVGQFFAAVGMRGNNLVCQVRMTDSNADDPMTVRVAGTVVTFR